MLVDAGMPFSYRSMNIHALVIKIDDSCELCKSIEGGGDGEPCLVCQYNAPFYSIDLVI